MDPPSASEVGSWPAELAQTSLQAERTRGHQKKRMAVMGKRGSKSSRRWLSKPDFCTQWSSSRVLSGQQASTPCRGFGTAARLLTALYCLGCTFEEGAGTEATLGSGAPCTHASSEIPVTLESQLNLHPCLRYGLELMISQGHDLGTAYAWFRTGFKPRPIGAGHDYRVGIPDLTTSDHDTLLLDARHPMWHDKRQVTQDREGNEVVMANVPPNRLWDVVANRVIPYYWHDQAGKGSGMGLLSMKSDKNDPYDATKSFIRLSRLSTGNP